MSTRSQPEFIAEVLERLGVLAAGQTAEVEDTSRVQELIPSTQAFLKATEAYYWSDVDNIPDDAFMPLVDVTAWMCRGKYGVQGDALVELKDAKENALRALKIMQRAKPSYLTLRVEYF